MKLINESLSVKEKKEILDTIASVMVETFSGLADSFTQKVQSEPTHWLQIQELCKAAQEISYTTPTLLQLKVCILQCLTSGLRDFEAARTLLVDIEKDLRTGFELEPYYKALFQINKGFIESTHGNYDEGIAYMHEGVSLLASYPSYNGERLRALTNLIQYHALRGETHIAEKFIQESLSLFESVHSPIYRSFFIYVHSMVLIDQRKFEEALHVLNETNIYPTLNKNFPHIYLGLLQQKVEACLKLKQLQEARKHFAELEERVKTTYSKTNVMWANMLLLKSLCLLEDKEIPHVIQYTNEALVIYTQHFQGDRKHRNQGRAHFILGKAHEVLANYTQALKEYLLSEEVYATLLKERSIDEVSELYKALTLLGSKVKDDKLVDSYLNAHAHTFGQDHFRTRELLCYLERSL